MSQIISVVPNVCEGRDEAFVEALTEKLEAVPGLVVLDVSMDQVRNRTIFSFTGRKEAVFEGGYHIYEAALGKIDMRNHQGEYPRIGAVDVFPFVALRDAPIATAVDWSVQFAEEVARRFDLPVYLFAEPARTKPTLANVAYGTHERQVLDFWKAESSRPTPVVFHIHGGGWVAGDKARVAGLDKYLAAGISVVSINYRFVSQAQAAGVQPPVKWPLQDAAQSLLHHVPASLIF